MIIDALQVIHFHKPNGFTQVSKIKINTSSSYALCVNNNTTIYTAVYFLASAGWDARESTTYVHMWFDMLVLSTELHGSCRHLAQLLHAT